MKLEIVAIGHFTALKNGQVLDVELKGKKFNVEASKDDTISKLKEKIKVAENLPVKQQVLNFQKKVLNDDKKTLDSLGIKDKAQLQLNSTLDGDEEMAGTDESEAE